MVQLQRINPRWPDGRCIVAATGPSLTPDVAARCQASGWPIIAVNDAYRLLPDAAILYACDAAWWDVHRGCHDFRGEKWSAHSVGPTQPDNDKTRIADDYGLTCVQGRDCPGFSLDPDVVHYGSNSGFQGINLAILLGATTIVLVGFDMHGRTHFFGKHPLPLCQMDDSRPGFERYIKHFVEAAKTLPPHIRIVNATPESALTCFPMGSLDECVLAAARGRDREVPAGLCAAQISYEPAAVRG